MSQPIHMQTIPRLTPFLCGVATLAPLLLGYFRDQLGMAVFGALTSYFLVLNDHQAPLRRRLLNFTLTFITLCFGLGIGIQLEEHPRFFALAVLTMTYFIGLVEAKNPAFEKTLLFAVFQMLAVFATPAVEKHSETVFLYAGFGYLVTVLAAIVIDLIPGIRSETPPPHRPLNLERGRYWYSFTYTLTVLITLAVANYFHVDHGYWAVGTVLITMRPDSLLSPYRSTQRLFGTLLGVLIAGFAIYYIRTPLPLMGLIFFACVGTPWALASTHWLGSGFFALVFLVLSDLPFIQDSNLHTPFLRLQATAIGCGLTIFVILTTHLYKRWARFIFPT